MSPKPQPVSAEAWGSVLRAHAMLVPRLDQRLHAESGLSLARYDVLLELNSAPGRQLRMSDLGDRVVLSRTRVSRVVDELAKAGLVTREANDEDRRSAYAVMTDEGRKVFRRAAPLYLSAIDDEFARHVSPDDLTTVRNIFERVIAGAREAEA